MLTAVFLSCAMAHAQDSVTTPSSGTPAPGAASQGVLPVPQPAMEPDSGPPAPDAAAAANDTVNRAPSLMTYAGVKVSAIQFEGVTFGPNDTLPEDLAQKVGEPLDPQKVKETTRRLYATSLYRTIEVRGVKNDDGVTLIFAGAARYFVGRVTIVGVKSDRLSSLLEVATQLQPGARFVRSLVPAAVTNIRQALVQNGFYQSVITPTVSRDDDGKQVDTTFNIAIGPQARVGEVALTGSDPGFTVEQFRKKGKLKRNSRITRDTTGNTLSRMRQEYQKRDRLEATVALEKSDYATERKQLDYSFAAAEGPVVKVTITGVKISKARMKKLLPIYEESAVDADLLNEGAHNIRDYMQREGYFDAEVTPHVDAAGSESQTVVFDVSAGAKHRVTAVDVKGNKYFDLDTIRERMQVVKADSYVRNGRWSQTLVQNDIEAISSLYRANGFSHVTVTPTVNDVDVPGQKLAKIQVLYTIAEGDQQKFGTVKIDGLDPKRVGDVTPLMNTLEGQPFSLSTVSGDRDAVLSYLLAHGFDQARVEVRQQIEKTDATRTDINFVATEGEQVFVDRLLLSGVNHTKMRLVNKQFMLKPNEPLDQSALVEMQRKFYDLALFNEANVAVQNPAGLTDRKNVLVQLTEAKRWDVTYGAGFEAQTGQPQTNCRAQASLGGSSCTPSGKAGASFRVSADVTRINLFGTAQSLTLHTTYGLLERVATLTLNTPRLFGRDNFTGSITGGYSNVQNISTFKASTLQGVLRVTQKIPRTDTLIYDFTYRRVSVDQNSLQVTANLIPLLSQPVRVGGPGITWFHDTRNPSPLDATKGQYLSVQNFFARSWFGSQTDFNRTDITHSSYYTWGKRRKYTFARSTRMGFIVASGKNPNVGVSGCEGVLLNTNASCDPVPLPERLYAGGATSHRGFSINSAGPRDLTTGYPVGGTGVLVNSFELRLPPPVLPVVGDSVSFVIFHDMGNTFLHIADMWPSIGRFKQPNSNTCKNVAGFQTTGTCDFNYFSHAIGLGARYHTPVGPIRVDFSYNLNPPIYPIIDDYSKPQPNHEVGQASHFQFFFSIGQSF